MLSVKSARSLNSTSYLEIMHKERALKGITNNIRNDSGLNSLNRDLDSSKPSTWQKEPYSTTRVISKKIKDVPTITKFFEIEKEKKSGKNIVTTAKSSHLFGAAALGSVTERKDHFVSEIGSELEQAVKRTKIQDATKKIKTPMKGLNNSASSDNLMYSIQKTVNAFSSKFDQATPLSTKRR